MASWCFDAPIHDDQVLCKREGLLLDAQSRIALQDQGSSTKFVQANSAEQSA